MGKLVRDRIPEIIEKSGEIPHTRILAEEEYYRCLEAKRDEEVAECHADQNVPGRNCLPAMKRNTPKEEAFKIEFSSWVRNDP